MNDVDGLPDDDIWNIEFTELEFVQEIAKGSFGKVYKGAYLGVDVAIKQILRHDDPAYMKYIEREISVLKGIRHPFVVGFSGVCVHHTGLYIVTEYVSGGDVRQLLKAGNVTWARRVQLASDLAKAMFYLHSKKILHRDLKSKNLLIGNDNRVRLCDFGFARISELGYGGKGARSMTICGTPGFVAPEIMLGNDYDFSCDVFSYGNVLAEFLTLKRPGKDFWIRNASDNYQLDFNEIKKHLDGKDFPVKMLNLAQKCVEYDSAKRPDFSEICKTMKEAEAEYKDALNTSTNDASAKKAAVDDMLKSKVVVGGAINGADTTNSNVVKLEMSPDKTLVQMIFELSTKRGELKINEQHLAKMIARASSPDFADLEYVQDLLLTYPCFATPAEMFTAIIERFNNCGMESFATPLDADSLAKRQQKEHMRLIVLLNSWIEKYHSDFTEPDMKVLIEAFESSAFKDTFSIEKAIQKFAAKSGIKPMKLPPRQTPLEVLSFLSWPSMEIAKQMTYIDSSIVADVSLREFLKEVYKYREDSRLRLHVEKNKEWARFTASCIVSVSKKDLRINVIQKFLEIAQHLLSLKNFNGIFGILSGLKHASVERLLDTWKALPSAYQTSYKQLKELTNSNEHYRTYKEKQSVCPSPSVPALGVYLEEIGYIDSFNPDIGQGGIINFSKHRKLARIIVGLQRFFVAYTDLKPNEKMLDFFNGSVLLDDESLSKNSLNCEKPSGF